MESLSINDLIEMAKTGASTEPEEKTASLDGTDIEKFASYLDDVGKFMKLGQDPQSPALVPPVKGTQGKADKESKTHDPTKSKLDVDGEVHTDEAETATGTQAPAQPSAKVASFRDRVMKLAGAQPPGNVGYTEPGDQTGLPEDPQKLQAVSQGQIEQANTVKPMQPLLEEHLITDEKKVKPALPEATKSVATTKVAEDKEAGGRVAAHAYMNELAAIFNGGAS